MLKRKRGKRSTATIISISRRHSIPGADDKKIIISVPASKQITSDFGRKVDVDLSIRDQEYKLKMFPLNIILDPPTVVDWQMEYNTYYSLDREVYDQFKKFFTQIITPTQQYQMPVILLDKTTPKEAVCQVFENVNTGGVLLTVFELVTAIFAMDDFQL